MKVDAAYFVEKLGLLPHPEGGWYRETYRSAEILNPEYLPHRFGGIRNISTGIYFLLGGDSFSAFHRIKSDEIWHFYYGSQLRLYVIDKSGDLRIIQLGNEPGVNSSFQAVVEQGEWFAAEVMDPEGFSLVGCTVAPGFDFADFDLACADELLKWYPAHNSYIRKFCR